MLGIRILGRKQGEQQIDGLLIDGLEVHRLFQTQEHRPHPHQPLQARVRQANTSAHAR